MATDSFKFWDSYLEGTEGYTDEEFGALIRALAKSVFYGDEPDFGGKSKFLKSTFCIMRAQAEQSRNIAKQAREAAKRPRPSRRKKKASDTLAHASAPSSEKKRSEAKGTEASHSLRECSGAAYAGAGLRPPATPAQGDPWDDPDYDGPIPYLGPDDEGGAGWA